jgi:hypothetical protein
VALVLRTAPQVLAHLGRWHPNLATAHWRISSALDDSYQCIAWAMGCTDRHAWPHADYWWFPGCPQTQIPEEAPVDHFIAGFSVLGYQPCSSKAYEFGYQKLAIYANEVGVTHMARQHLFGWGWLSKMGDYEDIVHRELDDIAGDVSFGAYQYGRVVQILKRSWWVSVITGCMLRCARSSWKHWHFRVMRPSWNPRRWNM